MKRFYIAAFVPELEGNYSVYFPDLPGAVTGGYSIEECLEYGEDILKNILQSLSAARNDIPEPSSRHEAERKVRDIRRQDELPYPIGVHYQYFEAPSLDLVPVKLTISLPASIVQLADKKAKEFGFATRSKLIAEAIACYRRQT